MIIKPVEIVQRLVQERRWPANQSEAKRQNNLCLVDRDVVSRVFPGESMIYFYAPPFARLDVACAPVLYSDLEGLGIVPGDCIIVGDLGLGSDAYIMVDDGDSVSHGVFFQDYSTVSPGTNHVPRWSQVAADFDEFLRKLGVEHWEPMFVP